jgi:Fe/S biogenesis protein NfuA
MITFTETARQKILSIMEAQGKMECGIRVRIGGRSSSGYRHELSFVDPGQEGEQDAIVKVEGFDVYVDPESAKVLGGTKIDYVEESAGGGFVFHNPNPVTFSDPEKGKAVQELIEKTINPAVSSHGGVVELLDVTEKHVFVKLGGGCQGCGMVNVTLKQGIERVIKEQVPGIESVVDTTDHADGKNPYYAPAR